MKNYSEVIRLKTFKERFEYLKLSGEVGKETFGIERYLNQRFYKSQEWQKVRHEVILRDMGCDLGMSGYEIFGKIIIHHMNPVTKIDLEENYQILLDSEYLICTSMDVHNALHYGDICMIKNKDPSMRRKNDTCPWK